jgi:RNA polymerase sigma-70 factor, ECF subfamily
MTIHRNTSPSPAPASTDAELLAAISGGDLSALGTLYDRHARHVWRVLYRVTGGDADVDDVLHQTFLQLPRLAASFDGRAPSCRSWLCGIATRLALRRGRSTTRFFAMLARLGATDPRLSSLDPEVQTSHREELRTLERAIASMSTKKRAVFVLVELEGLNHAEVSQILQIPLATVRTRLFGAKELLRQALLASEDTSGPRHE